ncbi:MAG TPA: AEC family transporter [Gammaproteobacteria bacterium]|nr:AEC family transporter [Gammaproteobacteria bacterium]
MSIADLLIPDFALILLGFLLRRYGRFSDEFWRNLERFVYYVLFPALLFGALARTRVDFASAAHLIETGVVFMFSGIALGYLSKYLFRPPAMSFASAFQCAFRFNSYVGFAILDSLYGQPGIAAFGLLAGFMVPIANVASVGALARHGEGRWLSELARNPLILATFSGLIWAALRLPLPQAASATLGFLGEAALPMGLIAVGASVRPFAFGAHKGLTVYLLAVKLLVLPAIAFAVASWLGLRDIYFAAALVLAALPTASSAYILTTQMGGDGELVASLIALNVLVAILTLPWWLTLLPG